MVTSTDRRETVREMEYRHGEIRQWGDVAKTYPSRPWSLTRSYARESRFGRKS